MKTITSLAFTAKVIAFYLALHLPGQPSQDFSVPAPPKAHTRSCTG